jgi:hypothetical protein
VVFRHSKPSEESLIIRVTACQQKPEMFRFAQHDKYLNPIHGAAASNVQKQSRRINNFRQKRKWLASLKERIHRLMNNDTTYALLVRSEEKGRSIMETAIYALLGLSAILSILQFVQQPERLPTTLTTQGYEISDTSQRS